MSPWNPSLRIEPAISGIRPSAVANKPSAEPLVASSMKGLSFANLPRKGNDTISIAVANRTSRLIQCRQPSQRPEFGSMTDVAKTFRIGISPDFHTQARGHFEAVLNRHFGGLAGAEVATLPDITATA